MLRSEHNGKRVSSNRDLVHTHVCEPRNAFVSIRLATTTWSFSTIMRAPLIELNRLKLVVSYPAAGHDCRFMSPRQWGRHVFLVSSHDDRNDSETRRRICSSSFFLLLGRPRPWRPTFVRINVRLATLATVPSSQLICKQQLGACCELSLKISRWFKRHHLDGLEEASGRIYDRTLVEEAHFLVVQKVDRADKETFNREGYRDFLETRSVTSLSRVSAFSLILCRLWGICICCYF